MENFGMPVKRNASTTMQNFGMSVDGIGKHRNQDTLASRYCGYMASFPERLQSFKDWPKHHVAPQPLDMAAAGFYYLGVGDQVRCFYCQVGVKNWEKGDSAIGEHQKWSPICPYLKYVTDKVGI